MQTITVKINGQEVQTQPNKTILEVVEEHKIDHIPTLCHSQNLEPYGSCFVCVVEVKGRRNLVPSCATRVAPDMEIETKNERVAKARKTALELLLSNHYADCVSPCKIACPAHVDVQGYIALASMGLYKEAVDLIRKTNPFPSICGRVCVRRCEDVCRREIIDEPVAINNIKRYVSDEPEAYEDVPARKESTGKKVAVVGAGPSGLTAAYFLGLNGHEVKVFEELPKSGGMLRYGIPEYRLPKKILDKEVEYITRASHATIEYDKPIGKDLPIDQLQKEYDAVYISGGAQASKTMRVSGEEDTVGVIGGAEFLREKTNNHDKLDGTIVIVGGGNTAMDAARVSWRLGAEKVIILYRRTKAQMPADPEEIHACIEEGIEIIELAAPVGIVRDENKKLKALKCTRMILGEPDSSGRRRPIPQEGSEFELPCDIAIPAIGQNPVLEGLTDLSDGIERTRWNTIVTDTNSMATNIPGVFAGGDMANDGPTVVIDAIADGGKAAGAMHKYLTREVYEKEGIEVQKEIFAKPTRNELGDIKESPRHKIPEIEVEERAGNFDEVANRYEVEEKTLECERCLACGCFAAQDCLLRKYATDYDVNIEHFKGYVRKHKIDNSHPYIIYDPNKCILCSRCVRTCSNVLSTSALGLVNRGFKTEMRPAMNDPLVQTNCINCGNCVDACPTGALEVKLPFPGYSVLPEERIESTCGFCSLACPITVRKYDDNHYFIESTKEKDKYLCKFGRFGNELYIKQSKINFPLMKESGRFIEGTWENTYEHIVAAMKRIAEKYGPESVAVFASPELTNEELYVTNKIAREGIKTNNIASLSILANGTDAHQLDESFGFTGSTTDREILKEADLIISNNSDQEEDNLILSMDVIKAIQEKGSKLIVCSSAENSLTKMAKVVLDPIRGRASLLWNAVLQKLLDEGHFDREKIKDLPGGEDFLKDTHDYSPNTLSSQVGVEVEKIEKATRLIKEAKNIVFIHSIDRLIDRAPGDLVTIANMILLLQNAGIKANLLLPSSYSNFAGTSLMGIDPAYNTGKSKLNLSIPGVRNYEDFKEFLEEGRLKAALIIGEDPMGSARVSPYFNRVEFMAVMDTSHTQTVKFADTVLPGCTYLQSRGTRCNFEGMVKTFTPAIKPNSGKMSWKVLKELAEKFGVENLPNDLKDLQNQIKAILTKENPSVLPFVFNDGIKREWDGKGKLAVSQRKTKPSKTAPSLTRIQRYKYEVRTVGLEHFKVH